MSLVRAMLAEITVDDDPRPTPTAFRAASAWVRVKPPCGGVSNGDAVGASSGVATGDLTGAEGVD